MNLIKKNNNTKSLLIKNIIIYLIIILCIFYFFILPTASDIKDIRDNIIEKKIDKEKIINREKNISILSNKLKKIEPKIEKINNIFINQSRRREFIGTLEEVAIKSNVNNPIITPLDNQKEQGAYQEIPLTISAEGTYDNIIHYLLELEKMNYYINIQSLEIISSSKNINSQKSSLIPGIDKIKQNTITIKILANTYWEK